MPYKSAEANRKYQREYMRRWRADHPEARKPGDEKRRIAYKLKVLTHYGGEKLACVRCSFSDIRALTIDHIDGSGHAERKASRRLGWSFYGWLINQGYPEGYQTLCMNCQFIKRVEEKEYLPRGGG